jgi:hypothetical protein
MGGLFFTIPLSALLDKKSIMISSAQVNISDPMIVLRAAVTFLVAA